MKVADAIEAYLSHQRQRGLEPSSVRTTGHALRTVLDPMIDREVADLGTAAVGVELVVALDQRLSKNTKKKLTPTTRELFINHGAAFMAWAVGQGWIARNPLAKDPAPAGPHLGQIVRRLREAYGAYRWVFAPLVHMNEVTLKAIETGRHIPTAEQIRQLLTHPAMARLPEMARNAGIPLPQDDDGVGEA